MSIFGVTVAISHEGKILLVKRADLPVWCLPGGMIEDQESLAQTAVREAREETGLEVELLNLVGVYSRPNWRKGGGHEILFSARPVGGVIQPQPGETVDVRFFDPHELPETLLWWHRQPIVDALTGKRGLSWSLDADWPFGVRTIEEMRAQISQEPAEIQLLLDHFCRYPQPGKEKREAGGN
jgi:ADP-ribose pyrophosphatase YjhB (NUDIX family)